MLVKIPLKFCLSSSNVRNVRFPRVGINWFEIWNHVRYLFLLLPYLLPLHGGELDSRSFIFFKQKLSLFNRSNTKDMECIGLWEFVCSCLNHSLLSAEKGNSIKMRWQHEASQSGVRITPLFCTTVGMNYKKLSWFIAYLYKYSHIRPICLIRLFHIVCSTEPAFGLDRIIYSVQCFFSFVYLRT